MVISHILTITFSLSIAMKSLFGLYSQIICSVESGISVGSVTWQTSLFSTIAGLAETWKAQFLHKHVSFSDTCITCIFDIPETSHVLSNGFVFLYAVIAALSICKTFVLFTRFLAALTKQAFTILNNDGIFTFTHNTTTDSETVGGCSEFPNTLLVVLSFTICTN